MKVFTKKALSLILSATLLITTFAGVFSVSTFAEQISTETLSGQSVLVSGDSIAAGWRDTYKETVSRNVWDGTTKTKPSGDGTEASPYLVSNGAELAWTVSNGTLGEYYKLTADIYLNDIDKIDWSTGEVASGYNARTWVSGSSFSGNLDGDGFVVYGIYYNAGLETSQMSGGFANSVGLIPNIPNGITSTITKIGVDNMFINAPYTASPIIGSIGDNAATDDNRAVITIDQCFAGQNVFVTAGAAGHFRGWSKNSAMSIYNSYSLATVCSGADANTYEAEKSWLIANGWNSEMVEIANCYVSIGSLYKGNWPTYNPRFSNCYSGGATLDEDGDGYFELVWYTANGKRLSLANMQGLDVFTNASKMPLLNSTGVYTANNGFPTLSVFNKGNAENDAFVGVDNTNGKGWGIRLEKEYGMKVTNAAIAGNSLTEIPNRKRIVNQLSLYKNNEYDFVLLQGGFNDAMGENVKPAGENNADIAPYGEISKTFNVADFDTDTFAGALEEYFYYAKLYYPNAKIGYIVTYQTPKSQYGGRTADIVAMRTQWDLAKDICEKWDVTYLDLFDGCTEDGVSFSELLDVNNATSKYFPTNNDNIHLNTLGYDTLTPHIAEWMITLSVPDVSLVVAEEILMLDFETKYPDAEGSASHYYADNYCNNSSAKENYRGSYTSYYTEADGNTAMNMSWDYENNLENYNANSAFKILNPSTYSNFVGEAGKTYTISFDYKVLDTDEKSLQFYIGYCGREHLRSTDLNNNYAAMAQASAASYIPFITVGDPITSETDEYARVTVDFPANGTYYPIIILSCNGKVKDTTKTSTSTFASVLVDNVVVAEKPETTESQESLDFTVNFEGSYTNDYYKSNVNSSYGNGRGSNAIGYSEESGNTAMKLTWDTDNSLENYNANAAINIYNPNTASKFVGEADKDYTISFDYKVLNADGKNLQFYIGYCGRTALKGTDLNNNATAMSQSGTYIPFITVGNEITSETDEYVRVTVKFAANGTYYPILLLSCNGKVKDTSKTADSTFASVLVDNINVKETSSREVKFYNYGGKGSHESFTVTDVDSFSAIPTPSCRGYLFGGYFKDAGLTVKIDENTFVANYKNVYVKWDGGGDILSPGEITNTVTIGNYKAFSTGYGTRTFELQTNSMLESPGANLLSNFYGSNVITSDALTVNSTEQYFHDGLLINITKDVDEVIFYVEVPDYEKVGADWALGLVSNGLCLKQIVDGATKWIPLNFASTTNTFEYIKDNTWTKAAINTNGHFDIPSGYKGYVKLDLSTLSWGNTIDFASTYQLNQVQFTLNAFGGEAGDFVFGGIFYAPNVKNESTILEISNTCYEMYSNSEKLVVNAYDAIGGNFSTRYQGTVGETEAQLINGDSSAFFTKPAVITSTTGGTVSTKGYLNTYKLTDLAIVMQPAVDTLMFYVEMPKFDSAHTALKLLDPTVTQGSNSATISFSNSIYKYMSVENGCWRIARAGADGELFDIPSGFKGYIKVDLKYFKGFFNTTNIDFTSLYEISSFEIGFNHFGADGGNFVLGGLYSVIVDSNSFEILNGLTNTKLCARVYGGDFNCDGVVDWNEIETFRKLLLGEKIGGAAGLRTDIFCNGSNPDITGLVHLRNCIEGKSDLATGKDVDNGVVYKNIFSDNYSTNTTSTVYDIVKLDPTVDASRFAGVIEADTELNYDNKAINFANEITNGFVGDFEKTGIDLMCHVSTFCYAKGNIYMTYYANTMSASENPNYQVARLAYAPEDNPEDKVVLDVMLVGDDLYGQKVTGVYDTILMQKEDEPDNLYVLWTASVQGKYYRLYRVFNMVTEEFGEIGVNKFKVGDISNDFSDSGIKNALAENGIGYKETFADIGIMQKLSTRVENGETYYYSGAYSGNFTCIIKSKDLITWEYVAQPNEGANGAEDGFENATKWENAVYVVGDKVYYFVRQWDPAGVSNGREEGCLYGVLTYYDLITGKWATPVLVGDCQSRSDFIMYKGELYLFYAPTDRSHIGILKVDTQNLANSEVVLQAQMNTSCFYPFVQYNSDGELCMSYTVGRKHIRLASFTLSNYLTDEDVPITPDEEYSSLGDALEIPVDVKTGYHYGDPSVGDTISITEDASWSAASFKVEMGNTYAVSFTTTWKPAVPHVYLCSDSGVIKQIYGGNTASSANTVTFTVTDESVTKVYVRSFSTSSSSITLKQIIDSNSTIDMNSMEMLKFEIATPYKYSAWPMIGVAGDKLVCLYTIADQHSATEAGLYMKSSSTNGLTWTEAKEIFTEKTAVKGITGVGQDSDGNMLIWYRNGSPGAWNTTHELYKTDGRIVTQVSAPDFALRGGHIGNIFAVEDELFCFYNTYGNTRSWGLLKSADDGLTWEQIPIEENIAKAECPVEIEGVYLGNGKILVLGRKDANEGTIAMFQIQSSDYGQTWTKEYTNITDAYGSSPSVLLDKDSGEVTLYFFARTTGQFKRRVVNAADVWDAPLNWTESEVLITEPYKGQDTGNVKTVVKDGLHFCTYYAGTSTTTGVYGVAINPSYDDESESETKIEQAVDVTVTNGYHYGDGVAGDSVTLTESANWSCGYFDAELGSTYTVSFTTAWTPDVSYVYLCDDNGLIKQVYKGTTGSAVNQVTFTVTDETVTKIYIRSLDYAAGSITATKTVIIP